MPVEHDVGAGIDDEAPERIDTSEVPVVARRVARPMEGHHRADAGMLVQLSGQPLVLRRAGTAAADRAALRVERDEAPGTERLGVPATPVWPRAGPEVVEVALSVRGLVVVIAGHGQGPVEQAAPGRRVAILVVTAAAVFVGIVTEDEDRAKVGGGERGRRLVVLGRTSGDVAGGDERDGRGRGRTGGAGRRSTKARRRPRPRLPGTASSMVGLGRHPGLGNRRP